MSQENPEKVFIYVPPPADEYPQHLERTIRALLTEGHEAGAKALEPIRYETVDPPPRRPLPPLLKGEILRRDRFHCRYCGGRVIPTGIMELVGHLFPDDFPYPGPGLPGGLTHPAFIARSPEIDHKVPTSHGGDWDDPCNLVTACIPCNQRKGDLSLEQLAWKVRDIDEADDWDGLTRYYRQLWEAAGQPPSHKPRMKALGVWEDAHADS